MTPAEVAALFCVHPRTVTRWADTGQLRSVRTLGGHRRYPRDEIAALVERMSERRRIAALVERMSEQRRA